MPYEMVGVEGFEPPTSCSQSRRATRLRYTPLNKEMKDAMISNNDGYSTRRKKII